MPTDKPQYISASRRNDLPRFHSTEFFAARRAGAITYDGGYGRSYTVSLRPSDVLGYVFWSKDYAPLIAHPDLGRLLAENNAIFHFTINDAAALEPGLAPLAARLNTCERLCGLAGPERVLWRYDPICRYRIAGGDTADTISPFYSLLPRMAGMGITRCYFSFMSSYSKLKGRPVPFASFDPDERREIAATMAAAAFQAGVVLLNCCNADLHGTVPGVEKAHCVDNDLLLHTDRFGVHRSLPHRPTREGCGCHESRDIGSYSPPCTHGCLYCYANPELPRNEDAGLG